MPRSTHRRTALNSTLAAACLGAALLAGGCAAPRATGESLAVMKTEAASALDRMAAEDPGIRGWIDASHGYAIFPSIGKGGIGVGGAYGRGLVYERGRAIATAAMTQATIGLQLGGQSYAEVVFFEDKPALDRFTAGDFEFAAQVSAVALTAGASADASFRDGMAIFTMQNAGLMYEASVGGQKFSVRMLDSGGA